MDVPSNTADQDLAEELQALREALLRAYRKGLAEPNSRAWEKALRGLGKLRPAPVETTPAVEEALEDADEKVRKAAAWVLEQFRGPG